MSSVVALKVIPRCDHGLVPDGHWPLATLILLLEMCRMTVGKIGFGAEYTMRLGSDLHSRELRRCSVQRPDDHWQAWQDRLETSTPMRPGSNLHWKRLGLPTSMQSGTGVRRGDIYEVPCGEGQGRVLTSCQ